VSDGIVQRAVRVLEALAAAAEPMSIRALAAQSGLSKSAAQRLLSDLVSTELAAQDPVTRQYHLGPRTLALGMAYQRRVDVRRAALPHMGRLRDATGETVGISVGLADQLLHVDQVESDSPLRAHFDIGRPLPLWSGAPARLLLAVRSDDEIRRILSERLGTDVTPVNPPTAEELIRDVETVRTVGYACAFEETLPGVSTMSVPIFGSKRELAAVLSITAPSIRLTRERVEEVLPEASRCAAAISSELGYLPAADTADALPRSLRQPAAIVC
jgi:DNA-binding IclR family transcriptional regulator